MIKKTIIRRDNLPYLIRWTIFKCKWFTIKIHKALMSDTADLHDHPWSYLSIILWGGYWEQSYYKSLVPGFEQSTIVEKWYRPGSFLFRKANKPHRLVIPEGKYFISLIIITRKWRDWGFMKNSKWVSHTEDTYE